MTSSRRSTARPVPRPEDLPPALDCLPDILAQLAGRELAVFLDYDGTLTPIVAHPDLATLSEEMREAVRALAARCTVAVVSGRDLADVRAKVGIDSAYYAGSHGFDLAGPGGFHAEHEDGAAFLTALDRAHAQIQKRLGGIPGAWAERKRFAIAVHYRQTPGDAVAAVEAAVEAVLGGFPGLRRSGGKKVFELRPRIEWHKGTAVLWLLQQLGLDRPGVLSVYIGDDETDEDAFAALRDRGIGIVLLGGPERTSARYSLRGVEEVRHFLQAIAGGENPEPRTENPRDSDTRL